MNSFQNLNRNIRTRTLPGPLEKPSKDYFWVEIPAALACWIGIAGLIILITRAAWAESGNGKSGFLPGARPFNPYLNSPGPSGPPISNQSRGTFLEDDDDDDLDEDMPMAAHPFSNPNRNQRSGESAVPAAGNRTFSAGNPASTANNGPEPIRRDNGIEIGGKNDVVSKGKIDPIHIDTETGEGSKEMITDFNFPDADILDIAKTLGRLTGKNFILDKDVKGRITIISNSPITVAEAWKAFLTALDINGFAVIPSGKYLRIARQRDARDKQLKTYVGDFSPDTDALITRVFPLKYISSEEVARTFRSFMPANSRIIPYEQTNTVIVTDTGSNILKLAKMLELLDVEGYDAGIEVIPVKFASASELSKLIDTLVPGTSSGAGGAPGAPRFGGGGGGRFTARRTKEGGIINTIIADERTNTLIVHANSRGADQVRDLVSKLDQKLPTSAGGGRVHVVYLQFADAEQIANTLNTLSQSTPGRGGGGGGGGGPGGGTGTNPIAGSLFEGSIKIAPDKATNSLVITASPTDFVTVQRVVNRLDIPRNQVYVEVVVMEVGLNKAFNYSANIVSAPSLLGSVTNSADLTSVLQNPLALFGGNSGVASFRLGNSNPITVNGQTFDVGSVTGFVKFLQQNSNANVLATPQIIALDNSEANFESAEKIPVQQSTAVQGAGVQNSITFQSVALSIKIKPQINKITNFVKLDVTTKLGDISARPLPSAVANQAFATLDRTAQTTVVVGDSDTIVLGGLIRDKVAESVSKVPLLGDIPILGWLFKSKQFTSEKSNLLIFMTPHIVRQYDKVRSILDRKLKERDDFLENNTGGEDPLREVRDNMIRSLPDLDVLQNNHPSATVTIDEDKQTPAAKEVETDGSQSKAAPFNPEDRAPTQAPVSPTAPPTSPAVLPNPDGKESTPPTAPSVTGQ